MELSQRWGSFGYGFNGLSQYAVERGVSRAGNDLLAVVCLGGKAGDLGSRIEWFFPLMILGQEERKLCWDQWKKAHQSHAIEFGLWSGTMNVKHITASTGPFICGGHHPHLLLEWPSVFTLLLSSILAVASVWHLFLPWLTLFCPHPRSSQLYRNTMRPGYTTDPLYALVSVSKYYYSLSLAPSHSSGGRKHCGFNLRVEKNWNPAVRGLSEW